MQRRPVTTRFGERVRALRESKGLSQEAFAELCDLHRTYIGAIERGEKAVTIITAEKLASALDLSLSSLFRDV
jgi:transcriptional regulator with XRE-family HTH domain